MGIIFLILSGIVIYAYGSHLKELGDIKDIYED